MNAFKFLIPFLFVLALSPGLAYAQGDSGVSYIYERPTYEKFAQLYWALSMRDPKKDSDVDNFLMINECDIYKAYRSNEFEWKGVRAKTADFLQKSAGSFPTRFEVTRHIKLGEYDIDASKFQIAPEYKLSNMRVFSIVADNYDDVCGFDPQANKNIPGYPKGLIIELSKPISLSAIPVDPDVAKNYVAEKSKAFEGQGANLQTDSKISNYRDAYLVMRMKFFAYKGDQKTPDGIMNARVSGILEGLAVYADPDQRRLLYKEDYAQKKTGRRGLNTISNEDYNDIGLPNPNPNLEPEPAAETKTPAQKTSPGKIEIPAYNPYGVQ